MTFFGFLRRVKASVIGRSRNYWHKCVYNFYTKIYTPIKAWQIRRKDKIRVAFVITEVGVWKTELLYLEMLRHPRFEPILLVLPSNENDKAYGEVQGFLNDKNYSYETLLEGETIQGKIHPDIIFYQKPYGGVIDDKFFYKNNLSSLFCYVNYGFHSVMEDWAVNPEVLNFSWMVFYENESSAIESKPLMKNKGRNIAVTGLPMTDEILSVAQCSHKTSSGSKKTIIWAPHHSVSEIANYLVYSTFMTYADYMLGIAEKYKDRAYFIFKPHPLLQPKLRKVWGDAKTEEYYKKWASMPNTRVEMGKYLDVFAESDAMIHDCGSFTIEYLYFNKPVMYLTNGLDHETGMAEYAKKAYHMHYFGKSEADIETFIENVLSGEDAMRDERQGFVRDYLQIPNNRTACVNIINAILGTA